MEAICFDEGVRNSRRHQLKTRALDELCNDSDIDKCTASSMSRKQFYGEGWLDGECCWVKYFKYSMTCIG
ncbi:hypothetical protein RchiOBHm_Chr5g0054951 [Rosa chinensis]|uniref:Uncharacterized protein n=1 Tax=Rosa chinensis TaxID=74649 RepID=A0A2P6QGA0_ROSCH|nr:hypothetical protein RchiOBHm_Chr5g0054951 [Rosa chinensis]